MYNKGDKVFIKDEIDDCCMKGYGNPEPYEILMVYNDRDTYFYFLSNHKEYTENNLIKESDLINYVFKMVDVIKSFTYQMMAKNN